MTILRPPRPKIMQNTSFVAARDCQELPGAARSCQERPPGTKIQETLVLANPRSHAIFQICYSISCFWKGFWHPFLDLINSKDCTHEYKLLNFSDLKKVAKTFFKHDIYQSEQKKEKHICLAKKMVPMSYMYYICIIYVLYMHYICIIDVKNMKMLGFIFIFFFHFTQTRTAHRGKPWEQ